MRDAALALRKSPGGASKDAPTAVLTHGANPGLVSHLVKQALLNIAADTGLETAGPHDPRAMGEARPDPGHQGDPRRRARHPGEQGCRRQPNEFVNTWSVDGFVSEGAQPAELGWGTHEKHFPADGGRHEVGSRCAIYLNRPGASTRVRTWTPKAGHFHGFLITHSEAISLADYYTVTRRRARRLSARPRTTPIIPATTRCCRCTSSRAATGICRTRSGSCWTRSPAASMSSACCSPATRRTPIGSVRSCRSSEARKLAPYNSATSLQVTVAALAGMIWAMENPAPRHRRAGRDGLRATARDLPCPYLGKVVGEIHRTGRRFISAANCSPRTSTPPIPGSSRTSASSDPRASGNDGPQGRGP